ncbi:unnamed protein product [marine sediment metagenome]|uniref:Uncharacterized protein n=1 Tax=marine sediment metagenome TaxID=412755 RepID=X1F0L2_9ZZZZ
MPKIIGSSVSGAVSYLDLIGAGIVKFAAERALTPFIGNGTLKSGLVKLGGGAAARKFLGKGTIGDSVSLGLAVDGVEDILTQFLGGAGVGEQGGENW